MSRQTHLEREESVLVELLDTINIIDVESTCWQGKIPEGQASDIIEIGLCEFDVTTLESREKHSIIIKPSRSTVSKFCTELTTLTQEDVDNGVSFEEACEILNDKFLSKRRLWGSYGDYDKKMFKRQCRDLRVAYPLGFTHINIKTLLAITKGLDREIGMGSALKMLDIPLEGTHHRGIDDAWNIGTILSQILRGGRKSLQ